MISNLATKIERLLKREVDIHILQKGSSVLSQVPTYIVLYFSKKGLKSKNIPKILL
jgi:hypothetical protein